MAALQSKPTPKSRCKSYSRVHKDLKELHSSPMNDCPPMCAIPYGDTTDVLALIVGPPNTAYAFGFFLFLMSFDDYPASPPTVRLLTTNGGLTRFNPNLYADGKVCLSILGTWEGDESEMWQPSYTIAYVLMAIQSMVMTDEPFRNEPGFEGYSVREKLKAYNAKVGHETIRLAVCDTMEAILDGKPHCGTEFAGLLKSQFLMYYSHYVGVCRAEQHRDGDRFEQTSFEWSSNQMAGQFDYGKLLLRLSLIKARLEGLHLSSLETTADLTACNHRRAAEIVDQASEVQRFLAQQPSTPCPADILPVEEAENPSPAVPSVSPTPFGPTAWDGSAAVPLPPGAPTSTTDRPGPDTRSVEILPVVRSDRSCGTLPDLQRVRQELEDKMLQVQRALECKQAEEDRLGALQSLSTDADSEGDDDDDDDDAEEFFIEDMDRHGDDIFSVDLAQFSEQVSHMKQVEEQLRLQKQQLLQRLVTDPTGDGGFPVEETPKLLLSNKSPPHVFAKPKDAPALAPSPAELGGAPAVATAPPAAFAADPGPPQLEGPPGERPETPGAALETDPGHQPPAPGDKWARVAPRIRSLSRRYAADAFWWRLTLSGEALPGREGAVYQVDISLPVDGAEFPRIQFATPIFHPNVSEDGYVWHPYASHYDGSRHRLADLVYHLAVLFAEPLGTPIACVNPYAAALCFSSGRDDAAEYRERLALCGQAARVRCAGLEAPLLQQRCEVEAAASRRLRWQCRQMQHEAYDAQKEITRKTELLKRTDTVIAELCRQSRLQKEMIDAQARVIQEKDEIAAATRQLEASSRLSTTQPCSPVSTLGSCDTSGSLDLLVLSPLPRL
eukprot:EG_transcript_3282